MQKLGSLADSVPRLAILLAQIVVIATLQILESQEQELKVLNSYRLKGTSRSYTISRRQYGRQFQDPVRLHLP